MAFFNKKQDVIDFQLTPTGRRQLSKGVLKPVYYEFYDDDILYDIEYTDATSEEQNNIQTRIKSNTPSFKGNARFIGASGSSTTKFNSFNNKILEDNSPNQYVFDNAYFPALGTFDSMRQDAPYFDIVVLNSKPSGLVTSSYQPISGAVQRIPQIEISCSYKFWYLEKEKLVYRLDDPLVISIEEKNTVLKDFTDNFEVQVFEITGSTLLPPKKFILEDKTSPKSFAEKSEETLKILKLNQEVTNRISEQLTVLIDDVYENSHGVKFNSNQKLFTDGDPLDPTFDGYDAKTGKKGKKSNTKPVECKDDS